MHTDTPHKKSQIPDIIVYALIVVFTMIAYANTFQSPFLFDDYANIVNNHFIRIRTLAPSSLLRAAQESPMHNRWLSNISFALNYYFHGYNPFGYHLVNILIHAATGCLVYLLLLKTLSLSRFPDTSSHRKELALVASMIWLLHPIQTNVVTYIVQRMTSMATLFYLASLLCYINGRLEKGSRRGKLYYCCSLLCCLGGFLSKENAAMLPIMILGYEFFILSPNHPLFNNKARMAGMLIGLCSFLYCIGWLYLGEHPLRAIATYYAPKDFTLGQRLLTEPLVVLHYLNLLAVPWQLRFPNLNRSFCSAIDFCRHSRPACFSLAHHLSGEKKPAGFVCPVLVFCQPAH
ncbi:hypothetical protein ACFL6N_01720 [Thermodesulfobacteriota bacterium]